MLNLHVIPGLTDFPRNYSQSSLPSGFSVAFHIRTNLWVTGKMSENSCNSDLTIPGGQMN